MNFVPFIAEWLSLLIRWLHIVAVVVWIGSAFYFIRLDLSLKPRATRPPESEGEAWQIHGGGFYHIAKYPIAPAQVLDELSWFKWAAYTTWLSGVALLAIVYYGSADLFLIDKAVLDLTPGAAIVISVGSVALAWSVYEALCRSQFGRYETTLALAGYGLLVLFTYTLTHVFSGRGAFVQIGALIGTIMVANVFVIIIPNQRRMVNALIAGQEPDPAWGEQSAQRTLHNNYLTLPVIFLMVSNHYPMLYMTRFNWLIVAIALAVGPLIRQFFNSRHAGTGSPWWTWAAAPAGMIAVAWLSIADQRMATKLDGLTAAPAFDTVENIVISRCSICHAKAPAWAGLSDPPKGIRLDTAESIRAHARLINLFAVRSHGMPPGNVTDMTDEERQAISAWIAASQRTP